MTDMLQEHATYQEAVVGAHTHSLAADGCVQPLGDYTVPPSMDYVQGVIDYGQYGNHQYTPAIQTYPPMPWDTSREPDVTEIVVVEREYDEYGRVTKETRTSTRPGKLKTPIPQVQSSPPYSSPNIWAGSTTPKSNYGLLNISES